MSDQNDSAATQPLLEKVDDEVKKEEAVELKIISETKPAEEEAAPKSPSKSVKSDKQQLVSTLPPSAQPGLATLSNEYRFVHQRIPIKEGKLRFLLPALLLFFQVAFIILFAFFGKHQSQGSSHNSVKDSRQYPLFADLHSIALLGFGFLMTFLKRYGYGSVGFNLLLVAFCVQWALLVRSWFQYAFVPNSSFEIGLNNLINADFTAIAVLVAFGAVLGKVTAAQLVVLALVCVAAQAVNEYVNVYLIQAHDVGRSVYVHLFGAVFGLAVSKALHFSGVRSSKQASVYHSDLFALIGTLFLWAYYPSFNGILAKQTLGQDRAIVNTYAAISASCVVTFAISSLGSKGKFNVLHVQHATIAGGIAIGSVADLNVQIFIALAVGAVAGLLSTLGYLFIDPIVNRVLKIHDTCSVQSLHLIPGLLSALLGALFAFCASYKEYENTLYEFYPARLPAVNTTEHAEQNIQSDDGMGRSAATQACFQLIALAITFGVSLVSGLITGLLLRLPLFEKLSQEVEMFDDEAQWVTPDDYALKLTFAAQQQPAAQQAESQAETKAQEEQPQAEQENQTAPVQQEQEQEQTPVKDDETPVAVSVEETKPENA